MSFTEVGNKTVAYAAFGYLWYTAITTISSIISFMSVYVGHSINAMDYFSMVFPHVVSIIGTGFLQLLIIFLLYKYFSNKITDKFDSGIAYLFAGAFIMIGTLLQFVFIPLTIGSLVLKLLRNETYVCSQFIYIIGQLASLLIEILVAIKLINKSDMRLITKGHE